MTAASPLAALPRRRIFVASSLALFTAGLSFSLRAAAIAGIEAEILRAFDPLHSGERAGALLGIASLGFAATLALATAALDRIGMGRALVLAGSLFALGTAVAIAAPTLADGADVHQTLRIGFLLCGLGWGFMEASINPLTATLYPEDATARLNVLHAWWPAGVITGGLIGIAAGRWQLAWQAQLAATFVPALATVALCAGVAFPRTARAAAGVAWGEMFRELLRRPLYFVWLACMFLTAASELAPGQWIDLTLTRTVGMRGIWLLVYVSGMMFVLRHFAGPIAHRLSNVGMLWGSVVLATAGLFLLPRADSPLTGLAAATIWGLGVCFLWPTMLANVAQRYPRGGELAIGGLAVAGALAIELVLPRLGAIFDRERIALAGGADAFAALGDAQRFAIERAAAQTSFETLALLPACLIVVFGAIWLWDRRVASRAAEVVRG
ncbi:MAG TPA: MFS transporter [Myxococcota bacterium]|nr:MFS transporter [Myxococcota bacterium]